MKVLTGGKFNTLHKGHLYLLKKAKELGYLVVVIAHDSRNDREYALSAEKRKELVEKTGIPDKVVFGNEKDFSTIIDKERPDIIVLGYDQELPLGTEVKIEKYNIKLVRMNRYGDYCSGKSLSSRQIK